MKNNLTLVTENGAEKLAAGVYELPFLVQGEVALVAVDSRGQYVKHARVSRRGGYALTEAWLDGLLEQHDTPAARPPLKLVR